MELKGKVALITGASSGIGEIIVKSFIKEGAVVMGCGRRPKPNIAESCSFKYISGDLTKFEDTKNIAKECVNHFGRIDILVNCAGVTGVGDIENTSVEEFERQFKVNVFGVFNMCKAAMEYLKQSGDAAIINISSELGIKAVPERIAYCPAKAAVNMLTQCLAVECAPNIRVNAILPGLVETPMTKERFDKIEGYKEAVIDRYILKKICTPEDVANAAIFFASEKSSFITGDLLTVCGGGHLHSSL